MSQLDWNEPSKQQKSLVVKKKVGQRMRKNSWAQAISYVLADNILFFPNCMFLIQSIM